MSEYQDSMCERITGLSEDELTWFNHELDPERVKALTDWIAGGQDSTEVPDVIDGMAIADEMCTSELTDPGFSWYAFGHEIVFRDDNGSLSVAVLVELIQAWLKKFRPSTVWYGSWANTCSAQESGAFHGGGVAVSATFITYLPSVYTWAKDLVHTANVNRADELAPVLSLLKSV